MGGTLWPDRGKCNGGGEVRVGFKFQEFSFKDRREFLRLGSGWGV